MYKSISILFYFFLLQSTLMSQNYDCYSVLAHRSFQQKLQVADGEIAYLDKGSGAPIMLLHGVPTSSWLYRHMVDDLVAKGFRVIVPDMLGFGFSDKPEDLEVYHSKKQAQRLIALMDYLGIENWTHVFHDMGSLATWEILLLKPERIKNLVVLNSISYEEGGGFKAPLRVKKRDGFISKTLGWSYKAKGISSMLIKSTLKSGTNKHKFSKADKYGYILPMQEGGNRAVRHFFTDFEYCKDLLQRVHQIFPTLDFPVTVIWGKKDKFLIGEKQVPLLKRDLNIKDADVHFLEEGAHFIQEEYPEEIVAIISKFVLKK